MKQEHKRSTSSYFVTLTYGPHKLPPDGKVSKRHVQLFFKKLRKLYAGAYLRYYLVAEYGSQYGRPHYHMLLFNADGLSDTVLKKCWEHGYAHIGTVSEASIMYTTKYMINRSGGFTLMSRKFGIGGMYVSDAVVAWHRDGAKNYAIDNGVKVGLPRFYKDKIWRKEELKKLGQKWLWQSIREQREDLRKLTKAGYTMKAIQDMRNAWENSVREKVAFGLTI